MTAIPENRNEPPETEQDGIRAGALRIAQYRHQNEQMRKGVAARPVSPEQLQEREQLRLERELKRAEAIANAERDAPIRVRFHEWMERSGFRPTPIPKPGQSYSGSHMETLWESYLDATLKERNDATTNGEPPMAPRPQSAQDMQDEAIAKRRKPGKLPARKLTASLPHCLKVNHPPVVNFG